MFNLLALIEPVEPIMPIKPIEKVIIHIPQIKVDIEPIIINTILPTFDKILSPFKFIKENFLFGWNLRLEDIPIGRYLISLTIMYSLGILLESYIKNIHLNEKENNLKSRLRKFENND